MTGTMLLASRTLRLILIGLVLSDAVVEAVGCPDEAPVSETACRACLCAPHLLPPPVEAVPAADRLQPVPSAEPSSYSLLKAESFFRPPRGRS